MPPPSPFPQAYNPRFEDQTLLFHTQPLGDLGEGEEWGDSFGLELELDEHERSEIRAIGDANSLESIFEKEVYMGVGERVVEVCAVEVEPELEPGRKTPAKGKGSKLHVIVPVPDSTPGKGKKLTTGRTPATSRMEAKSRTPSIEAVSPPAQPQPRVLRSGRKPAPPPLTSSLPTVSTTATITIKGAKQKQEMEKEASKLATPRDESTALARYLAKHRKAAAVAAAAEDSRGKSKDEDVFGPEEALVVAPAPRPSSPSPVIQAPAPPASVEKQRQASALTSLPLSTLTSPVKRHVQASEALPKALASPFHAQAQASSPLIPRTRRTAITPMPPTPMPIHRQQQQPSPSPFLQAEQARPSPLPSPSLSFDEAGNLPLVQQQRRGLPVRQAEPVASSSGSQLRQPSPVRGPSPGPIEPAIAAGRVAASPSPATAPADRPLARAQLSPPANDARPQKRKLSSLQPEPLARQRRQRLESPDIVADERRSESESIYPALPAANASSSTPQQLTKSTRRKSLTASVASFFVGLVSRTPTRSVPSPEPVTLGQGFEEEKELHEQTVSSSAAAARPGLEQASRPKAALERKAEVSKAEKRKRREVDPPRVTRIRLFGPDEKAERSTRVAASAKPAVSRQTAPVSVQPPTKGDDKRPWRIAAQARALPPSLSERQQAMSAPSKAIKAQTAPASKPPAPRLPPATRPIAARPASSKASAIPATSRAPLSSTTSKAPLAPIAAKTSAAPTSSAPPALTKPKPFTFSAPREREREREPSARAERGPTRIKPYERAKDLASRRALFENLALPSAPVRGTTVTVPEAGRTPGRLIRQRIEARQEFERGLKEREDARRAVREQEERERLRLEAIEDSQRRKETIVWANPVPDMYRRSAPAHE